MSILHNLNDTIIFAFFRVFFGFKKKLPFRSVIRFELTRFVSYFQSVSTFQRNDLVSIVGTGRV